jgi:hypothetical protein
VVVAVPAGWEPVEVVELDGLVGDDGVVLLDAEGEVLGAGVECVDVSGSTYCWSPAEVVVPPDASAGPAVARTSAATIRQAKDRIRERTRPIEATTAAARCLE